MSPFISACMHVCESPQFSMEIITVNVAPAMQSTWDKRSNLYFKMLIMWSWLLHLYLPAYLTPKQNSMFFLCFFFYMLYFANEPATLVVTEPTQGQSQL